MPSSASRVRRLRRRGSLVAAAAAGVAGSVVLSLAVTAQAAPVPSAVPAPGAVAPPPAPAALPRQQAFDAAAREFAVPLSVLLGVSYLESRWDANGGRPSVSAGYGPLHLTDAATATGGAATGHGHHGDGAEDARGEISRPLASRRTRPPAVPPPAARTDAAGQPAQTVDLAARLTGVAAERLRGDPVQNIRGGAALLAHFQRSLGGSPAADPAAWYGAVARYGGGAENDAARRFADEVYATIRSGAARRVDDGSTVRLAAAPGVKPDASALARLGLRPSNADETECPSGLGCEWIPAPYQQLSADPGDYGNHDKADRPDSQKITHIVIHDTETSYAGTIRLVQDPAYVSWQYTIRSADGHVAQHVKHRDVAWQAGNWYINAKSIGIEHEGFLAQGGSWYTEAMYRSSAALVRYLAGRYDIPRDRAHIIGHDNVPGTVPSTVRGMHEDPGPYWDWAHYFDLLKAPLRPGGDSKADLVTIRPDYATNKVPYTGCDAADPAKPCPEHGGASVMLRTEPRADAPLVRDIGKHPPNGEATMSVYDHSARASTGQRYAVAGRAGNWTAIWYLGQKAWFSDPAAAPAALPAKGKVVTPKPGRDSVPVYGRAYPEAAAYPKDVPVQDVVPLQYTFAAGQRYSLGGGTAPEYYYATTFDPAGHTVVRGKDRYLQIQFGHRVMFVRAADVEVRTVP